MKSFIQNRNICKSKIVILNIRIILLLMLLSAQEIRTIAQHRVGLTVSHLTDVDILRFTELIGAASYDSKGGFNIELIYLNSLNNWLDFETGLGYSKYDISISPNLPPNIKANDRQEKYNLVDIPFSLRANFLKFFFINAGGIISIGENLHKSIDSQSGIGALLGLAGKYDFKNGVSVFVNPYLKAHALIPFSSEQYHQRIFASGFRFGVTYSLNQLTNKNIDK